MFSFSLSATENRYDFKICVKNNPANNFYIVGSLSRLTIVWGFFAQEEAETSAVFYFILKFCLVTNKWA